MSPAKKSSASKSKKERKVEKEAEHIINFGRFHEYAQIGEEIEKLHKLTEEEKRLLIDDFKKIKKVETEEEAELEAIRHFEKKLQELLENIVYLDGYVQQIEEGNSMLRINPSVKELGNKLVGSIEEIEKLSQSMLDEEKKILGLAKHVRQVLSKAKKYKSIIFG